jgi:hypothetical protein
MVFNLLLLAGLIWLTQFFLRALWALFFGGPDVGKFLKAGAPTRETGGIGYWSIVVLMTTFSIFLVFGSARTAGKVFGVDLFDNQIFVGLGLFFFCFGVATTMGWILWQNVSSGSADFTSSGRTQAFDRRRQPLSYWCATLFAAVVFLATAAGAVAALAVALGFLE